MWLSKKPSTPQPAGPEPRNLQANEPPKSVPAFPEGLTRASTNMMGAKIARACVGPNLHVKGEISGNEDLLIDGSVEGLVELHEGNLTIATTAKLTADIVADVIVVYGQVQGNVRAKNRIEIKKDSSVTGDLTTPQILIEDGAFFKGSIEIAKSAEKDADKNVSSPSALAKAAGAGPKTT